MIVHTINFGVRWHNVEADDLLSTAKFIQWSFAINFYQKSSTAPDWNRKNGTIGKQKAIKKCQ